MQEPAMSGRFQELVANAKQQVREVSVEQALQEQQAGAVLVDVRESEEVAKGKAVGALPISKGVLELRIEERVPDADTPILCYCGGGSRSALAAESLRRMGYKNAASVAGGFKAWQQAGLPVE
jgi:rhodanese-related sulfurtransferase